MKEFVAALFSAPCRVRAVTLFQAQTHVQRTRVKPVFSAMVVAVTLAGCSSIALDDDGGGGDGINDARLGVAASPRVTRQETNLPRGGGRTQVGRPYRIAGQLYTPREDPSYDRTGEASWYGRAFHGRLTANGEVFDMHTLSAAHPTLPLPSYVRVTNVENDYSVVVRVNDRGPFANDRIIDLSRRAADVLAFRDDGVARVRVQYLERAPLHGQDVEWLEASARIDGVPVNGGDPNILLARAPIPAPTPTARVGTGQTGTSVETASALSSQEPERTSFLNTLFGRTAPQPSARIETATPISVSTSARTRAVQSLLPLPDASGPPLDLTPVPLAQAPSLNANAAVPTTGLIPSALVPTRAIPTATVPATTLGFTRFEAPVDLETGFTHRHQRLASQSQVTRVDQAHRQATLSALGAAEQLALQSETLTFLTEHARADGDARWAAQSDRQIIIQIGVFGDQRNVDRIKQRLNSSGEVVTTQLSSGGRTLTQVRLRSVSSDEASDEILLRSLATQGYTDAYITGFSDS
ncbi:MAG: septal ring lytic transglycosylase RlpA family protein [Pseudomonadota bacterium]